MSEREEVEQAIESLGELRLIDYHTVGNEIVAQVETLKKSVYCPICGSVAEPKDRRTSTIRDLPIGNKPLVILWKKRVWSCTNPDCPQVTWTETADWVSSRHSLTNRAKLDLARQAMIEKVSVAQLAQKWKISWSTAMSSIKEVQDQIKVTSS
ncbi:MAG: transposase family protein [Actinomycetota bacterium]|jgi:transposase|nr:transposase family protein [Actinomycetota bacterium]